MEWIAIALWALVVGLALPLAVCGGLTAPSLGVPALLTLAGLVLCILYVAADGGRWMVWVASGVAAVSAVAVAMGLSALLSDEPRTAGSAGQDAEELAASVAGVELALLLTVAFVTGLAAAGLTTVG